MNSPDLVANAVNYANLLPGSPPGGVVRMSGSRQLLQLQDAASRTTEGLQQIHVVIEDRSNPEGPKSQVTLESGALFVAKVMSI